MEIWKEVEGFEDYEVSTHGRVRRGNLLMKFFDNGLGYMVIRLNSKTFKKKKFYVHRLVMTTFQPTFEKLEVNHIDHDKKNNNISNLEWVSHKENLQKAVLFLGRQAFRPAKP